MLIASRFPKNDREYGGIRTHRIYMENILKLIEDKKLSFEIMDAVYSLLKDNGKIIKKLDIVRYTVASLKSEYSYAKSDEEFLPLSLSWLWIKGYYIIFHLATLLIALENKDSKYILSKNNNGHRDILSKINNLLINKKPFNITDLNIVESGVELEKIKTSNYENLKEDYFYSKKVYLAAIRKVFRDESNKLRGIKGEKRKKEKLELSCRQYSIFSSVLNYRERFNYIGFHYLNTEVAVNQDEVRRFYFASYKVIVIIVRSLVQFLEKNAYTELKENLREIQNNL